MIIIKTPKNLPVVFAPPPFKKPYIWGLQKVTTINLRLLSLPLCHLIYLWSTIVWVSSSKWHKHIADGDWWGVYTDLSISVSLWVSTYFLLSSGHNCPPPASSWLIRIYPPSWLGLRALLYEYRGPEGYRKWLLKAFAGCPSLSLNYSLVTIVWVSSTRFLVSMT